MKILVLSDTHAYLENARAVLARLQGKVDASRGIMIIAWIRLRRSWYGLAEKTCS